MKNAYFAGGCFWCITPTFAAAEGVAGVTAGYSGGAEQDPTYLAVKHQQTGHRETIRIEYDEGRISFETLLGIFLDGVDPYDAGGQFIDRGHSYTLAIYYCDAEEERLSRSAVDALEAESGRKVYVAIEPFTAFYTAEEEHQDYYKKHPEAFHKELVDSGRIKE